MAMGRSLGGRSRNGVTEYKDPVTGDPLTRSELVSWHGQAIIRRWTFIVLFSLVTFTVWAIGNALWVEWWNYAASWLALVIESVVGIAMFGQVRRDAVVLRELRSMARKQVKAVKEQRVIAETQAEIVQRLEEVSELMLDAIQRNER